MKSDLHHIGTPPSPACRLLVRLLPLILLSALAGLVQAQPLPPPITNTPPWLDSWSFDDTNAWTSDLGYAPVSFTNLSSSYLGEYSAVVVDSTNQAWLQYNVCETNGTTNLTVDQGGVMFWFAPYWSGTNEGGTGPGEWGRLLEVGSYTDDGSGSWWSIYVDPDGVNLYFSAQTNGSPATTYLSSPIDWTTNRWHMIALTYASTNSALYLDGELATNGPGLTVWPGPDVLTNGFFIGSDSNGLNQAHGMYDQLVTYAYPIDTNIISGAFYYNSFWYYADPLNFANFSSAPSQPQTNPVFNAVTGPGFLIPVRTNTTGCATSGNIWITNVVAAKAGTNMNLTFTIAGGYSGTAYDVFANSVLDFSSNTNRAWAWMGQGYPCVTYALTNLPNTAAFLILGNTNDSDSDGLTDAYERLVSKTDPNNKFSDGTGMLDGWEVLYFGRTGIAPNADPDGDGLSNYQEYQMWSAGYNPMAWDSNGNGVSDGCEDYSGDGLANLMKPAFGGSLMVKNTAWRTDGDDDGLPDLYEPLIGLSPSSAEAAPVLPTINKNPIP